MFSSCLYKGCLTQTVSFSLKIVYMLNESALWLVSNYSHNLLVNYSKKSNGNQF